MSSQESDPKGPHEDEVEARDRLAEEGEENVDSTRRALLHAGWTAPVIMAVTAPATPLSPGSSHSDSMHNDSAGHHDADHRDEVRKHTDSAGPNPGHSDIEHVDMGATQQDSNNAPDGCRDRRRSHTDDPGNFGHFDSEIADSDTSCHSDSMHVDR